MSTCAVHGVWQNAATWDLLTPVLRGLGHSVVTPLLTGLGTHPSALTPEANLSRHIEDVVLVVKSAAAPVTLVGHSYAGMIISGEVKQVAVDNLAYLYAFIPANGQCALDLLPTSIGNHFRELAGQQGDGWRLPGGEAQLDLWGLPDGPAREFPAKPFFLPFAQKAREIGWPVFEIDCGHDCQVENPSAVAAALTASFLPSN